MLFEEWNDYIVQVIQAAYLICHSLSVISSNHAAPKKMLECMEQLDISLLLYNCEFRKDLITGSHLWVPINADEKTSFAVHESNDPLRFQFSRR